MSAQIPVEGAERKAVPGERELEGCDVPSARAEGELTPPERRAPAVPSERLARAWPRDAVRRETRAALKAAERPLGTRPEDAVDGPEVQSSAAQTDLKRGDVGVAARESAACKGRRKQCHSRESRRQRPHLDQDR